tara:strand:+ start:498 stop:1454 length:957 start_codon:yes stop_codon:yes gene_type:complete
MHCKIGLKNKLRKIIIMDKGEDMGDGPAFVGALVAGAAVKAGGKKSRAKRKARRSKRKAKKAGRMEKRAARAEARGNTKRAGILKAKAGAKREKSAKLKSKSEDLKSKAEANKTKRKKLGDKVKSKVKGAVKGAAKVVKKAASKTPAAKAVKRVVKNVKTVKKVAKAAVAGAKSATAMYGKKGPANYMDTDPEKIAKREEKGQGVDLGAQSKDPSKEAGMTMYNKEKKNEEKFDMKEAYDKKLSGDARLHYLENARADKKGGPGNAMYRAGMKGPSMMGKIQYGQSSKVDYSKGNGRPTKGLSMMGHPSFIKGGKKKK